MVHSKFRTYSLFVVFIAAIIFPILNGKLKLLPDIPGFENRAMAKEPVFDVEHLDPFPPKYDAFYNDNFGIRNRLIRYFNLYNIFIMHKSPLPDKVVIGSNGWLYTMGEEMDSYMGKNRLTASELKDFKLELEYRKNYLAEKGIRFYFLVVPCKASIHTENIGYEYFRMSDRSWGEELNDYLVSNSTIKPINAFDSLRRVKETPLYYRLDNHWNSLGAFYTSNVVIRNMQKDFPDLAPLSLNDFSVSPAWDCEGNLQTMLGPLEIYSEQCTELHSKQGFKAVEAEKYPHEPVSGFAYPWDYEAVREIKGSKKPKLLIISDSFGRNIFPFLAENFSRTVKIFDAWQYKLNAPIVEAEKPDAVLLMIDEPILRNFLKFPSRPQAK